MKKAKRILVVFLALVFTLTLTACDIESYFNQIYDFLFTHTDSQQEPPDASGDDDGSGDNQQPGNGDLDNISVVSHGDLTVHFIDVGQGDSCIIELPDDRKMLIDAGNNNKTVKNKLTSYITENIFEDGEPIDYFDFVILTHSDADHIGSMAYILETYDVGVAYRPNEQCTYTGYEDPALTAANARNCFWGEEHGEKSTVTYKNALAAVYEKADEVIVTNPYDDTQNCITSSVESIEYSINFYSPLSPEYSDHNDYSSIMVLEYLGKSIVLSGDAEAQNEAEFVAAATAGEGRFSVFDENFCADVIKLGHHGSRTSSSEDYLNIMTNERRTDTLVIISCGTDNSYGHPHQEVLDRLLGMGFYEDNILRTDQLGDIVIAITTEVVENVSKAVVKHVVAAA